MLLSSVYLEALPISKVCAGPLQYTKPEGAVHFTAFWNGDPWVARKVCRGPPCCSCFMCGCSFGFMLFLFFSKTGFCRVVQAGIELPAILLTQPPEYWTCRGWPKHLMITYGAQLCWLHLSIQGFPIGPAVITESPWDAICSLVAIKHLAVVP